MNKIVVMNGLKAIPTHITLKKGAQFRKIGFVAISGLIKSNFSFALKQDAIASAVQDEAIRDDWMENLKKQSSEITAYQSAMRSLSTSILPQFQTALLPLLRTLTGHLLVPSKSWYIYYEGTDEIRPHVDSEENDISVLTSVLGEVGPLHFYPDLKGQNQNQLDNYYQSEDWNPIGGIPLSYPYDGILINQGHKIPHHRVGKPISQRCAVAVMNYTIQ